MPWNVTFKLFCYISVYEVCSCAMVYIYMGAREQCWSLFSPSFIEPSHRTQVVWFTQQTYLLLNYLSNPASCFYLFLRLCHIAQASLKLMVLIKIAKLKLNP